MQKIKHRLPKISIRSFVFFYVISATAIILAGFFIRNHKEIEEYKQVVLWYENLSGDNPESENSKNLKKFENFLKIKDIYKQLSSDYPKNSNRKIPINIDNKIKFTEAPESGNTVIWKIGKTEDRLTVYYDYVSQSNFNEIEQQNISNQNNNQEKQKDKDRVFLIFTDIMINTIQKKIESLKPKNNNNDVNNNLDIFSQAIITYLTNDKSSDLIPYLRINSVYITNLNTGLMMSYPFIKEGHPSSTFKTRPWYRASQKEYYSDFVDNNEAIGLTGIYIDINDVNKTKNPNAIRTLWYKFEGDNNQQYILCVDLFFDKSSQFSQTLSWVDLLKQSVEFLPAIPLNNSNNRFLELLLITLLMALAIEIKGKSIILKSFRIYANTKLPNIILKRDDSNTHYASQNGKNIEITFQGEIKNTKEKELTTAKGWKIDSNIQISAAKTDKNINQNIYTHTYVFKNNYDLDINSDKLKYRCVEGWNVILSGFEDENIGHFIVTWSNKNTTNLAKLIDIQIVTYKREYNIYLESIKRQLQQHLLASDKKEFIPILTTDYIDYIKSEDNHPYFEKIKSFKKLLLNSSYLKQGRIPVLSIEDLIELYKQPDDKVYAICTLNFLKQLLKYDLLRKFLEVPVEERYFMEHKLDEFRDFYNSQDSEDQSFLKNQSQLKIITYVENSNNIIHQQDDFCIIECDNMPNLVAYSFTDDQNDENIGWISSREVDFKFYHELFHAQKTASSGRTKNVENYLNQ
ncbi:MAG: hypothetical protein HEQ10_16760 [Dolichospermum sp. DEX182a]|nr:hypothetical protein [Dolichospermum sp. DEX182a]